MLKRWVEPKEYQLQTGEWVPQAHVMSDYGSSIEAEAVMSSRDLRFATREQARAHSLALGRMVIEKDA